MRDKTLHTKESIIKETYQHKVDIAKIIMNINGVLVARGKEHDNDKLIPKNAELLADSLNNGNFSEWNKVHMEAQRHHNEWIVSNVYKGDTNVLDLLEMIIDSIASNKRRGGKKPTFSDEYLYFINKGYEKQLATILANSILRFYEKYEIQ